MYQGSINHMPIVYRYHICPNLIGILGNWHNNVEVTQK